MKQKINLGAKTMEEIEKVEVEKEEKGIKKDFIYWIAIGVLLGMVLLLAMQNEKVVDQYNSLVYEYNNNCRDLTPIGGVFELNMPVEIGLNDTNLAKDEG